MTTAVGQPCTLSPFDLHGNGEEPSAGTQIRSSGGSWYLVTEAHRVTPRGILPDGVVSRWRLECVKISERDVDPDGHIMDLNWYERRAR